MAPKKRKRKNTRHFLAGFQEQGKSTYKGTAVETIGFVPTTGNLVLIDF